jgi:uncharacterized protein (DUF1015 family)
MVTISQYENIFLRVKSFDYQTELIDACVKENRKKSDFRGENTISSMKTAISTLGYG